MGSTVLVVVLTVLCVLAIVFLIYIFVQFWRETTRLKRRLEQKIKESKVQTNARELQTEGDRADTIQGFLV